MANILKMPITTTAPQDVSSEAFFYDGFTLYSMQRMVDAWATDYDDGGQVLMLASRRTHVASRSTRSSPSASPISSRSRAGAR